MTQREQLTVWLSDTASGDQGAFQRLYDATAPQLYALLLRMLHNEDRAQDALQDAYIKIWNKANTYAPGRGAPMTWLLSIARYRALDMLRRNRREVAMPDNPDSAAILLEDHQGPNPLHDNETRQSLDAVNTCLDTLEEKQRKGVLLAYFEGCTHEELSHRMDAPLGTVKSWIKRGLARLRQCLAEATK